MHAAGELAGDHAALQGVATDPGGVGAASAQCGDYGGRAEYGGKCIKVRVSRQ